jgi:hypothetical protein
MEGLYAFFAGSPTQLIAKRGDPVPGSTGTLNAFSNPSMNTSGVNGRVAARATISGGSSSQGVFAFFAGSPAQTLALQGQVAPGTTGATYVSFGDPVINDLGQVVVKATLTGGQAGAPTEGIFAFFAGSPSQDLVVKGDPAAEGGTYLEFLSIAYNDVAQIVFVANVTGGPSSQGVFIASLDLDRDGKVDVQDNCPTTFNTDQNNTDSSLAAAGATVPGDGTGNACDTDDDNDQFSDTLEAFASTNPVDNCPLVPGSGGDAWPADVTANKFVDTADIVALTNVFGVKVSLTVRRRRVITLRRTRRTRIPISGLSTLRT